MLDLTRRWNMPRAARASLESLRDGLAGHEGMPLIYEIFLLRNLRDIGSAVSETPALLSNRVEQVDGPGNLDHAFTVRIAQHYLDAAKAAVVDATAAVEHATNALISLTKPCAQG